MAEERLIEIVNDCVNMLASGKHVDDCLRAYPEYADQLAPMLEAGRLSLRAQALPDEVALAKNRVRDRFEQSLRTPTPQRVFPLRRLASLAAAVVLIFGLMLGGTVAVAQNSLPGDSLYGIKRWSEDVRLFLSGNNETLRTNFDQRRVDEIYKLFILKRETEVNFEGVILTITPNELTVAGLPIQVTVQESNSLQIGERVQVHAMTTASGRLIAQDIQIIEQQKQPLAPTAMPPTVTTTPTPSSTATNTPVLSATATMTQTSTNMPVLMETNTPSPTKRPSSTPTVADISTETDEEQTEQPACVPAPPAGWVTYKVQAGNTLSGLIAGSGVSLAEVMRANCIEDPNLITVGAVFYLPYSPASVTPERESNGGSATPGNSTSGGENNGNATSENGSGETNGNPDDSGNGGSENSGESGDDSGGNEHHGG
jgi:LysM repeat protein